MVLTITAFDNCYTHTHNEKTFMATLFKSYQQDGYKFKKEEIEGAILKRILSLFHIACRNWPVSSLLSTTGIDSLCSTSVFNVHVLEIFVNSWVGNYAAVFILMKSIKIWKIKRLCYVGTIEYSAFYCNLLICSRKICAFLILWVVAMYL